MAKSRKTLKEKKQAQTRAQRQLTVQTSETDKTETKTSGFTYKGTNKSVSGQTGIKNGSKKIDEDSILIVPAHYLKSDLIKTFSLSLFFLMVIFGLYWYFEMGGITVIRLGK